MAGVLMACTTWGTASGKISKEKVRCEGGTYRYVLSVPEASGPRPVMVLLHGAGDSPEPMVEAWKRLAAEQGIVLVAPELPRELKFEAVAPAVFVCAVEDSKRLAAIDAGRVYVFGNSMGGYLAYDAALLRADYFAGAAVHAMGIDEDYRWILGRAVRKTPLALYAGEVDPLVAVAKVRRTRDDLVAQGFPVHYVEIRRHDHNYYAVSEQVNADAWETLKRVRLPEAAATAR